MTIRQDNTNRHFQGQQKNERLVYFARKHWITLVPILIEAALCIGAAVGVVVGTLLYAREGSSTMGFAIAAVIVMTIWMHHVFVRLLNYFLDIVLITNFRIINIEKTLFLKNDKNVVDLHEIQDIKKFQHGITPNLLNYGKLVVVVPTMIEPMILEKMPAPDRFFRKINNAKRDYIYGRQQQRLNVLSQRQHNQIKDAVSRTA